MYDIFGWCYGKEKLPLKNTKNILENVPQPDPSGTKTITMVINDLLTGMILLLDQDAIVFNEGLDWRYPTENAYLYIRGPSSRGRPSQKETSIPTIHFRVQFVSFREGTKFQLDASRWLQTFYPKSRPPEQQVGFID